jgi:hypothetical protein
MKFKIKIQMTSTDASQEAKINKGIPLKREAFSASQGIFSDVVNGTVTAIVKRFNEKAT